MVKYQTIVADPPWKFGDKCPGKGRGAAKHYDCLTVSQLQRFPLPDLADDCYLFLWRVSAMQQEALDVVKAWGFVLKTELVWQKQTEKGKTWFGMGYHLRAAHETCIVATRGRPKALSKSIRSVLVAPVPGNAHSAKPDAFYELVEAFAPGPRVELFARRQRAGWTTLGNDPALNEAA